MQLIPEVSCFAIVDDKLIHASGKSVYWLDRSVSFEEKPFRFQQTRDFLIVVTGDNNIGFLIKKGDLSDQATWSKIPRPVSIFSLYYQQNQIILFSGVFRDETRWIFSLNDHNEKEYPRSVSFVRDSIMFMCMISLHCFFLMHGQAIE